MRRKRITVKKTRVNDQITVQQVRLIDKDGGQVGIMDTSQALEVAQGAGLDLVEISPHVDPPVCRVMDYGKYIYDQRKRKQKQKQFQLKEIKFRPVTDVGDYQVKVRKICQFLEKGNKVKISLRFRGREMQHKELGMELLERIKLDLPSGYSLEQAPKLEGRQISMIVALTKHIKQSDTVE